MLYKKHLIFFIATIPVLVSCGQPPAGTSVNSERFLANVTVLASDDFGGRAPMSEGERLTLDFLEGQFREAGLEPLFGESYLQAVPLTSLEVVPGSAHMSFDQADQSEVLEYAEQYVAFTHRIEPRVEVSDSEIVFVGYGVVAPEYGWNDYEHVDMSGKTALILVNDPGFAVKDEAVFRGRAMTYYGRWIYKLEEAARQGAAAALIIHETAPASYGWDTVRNSWTSPGFNLPPSGSDPIPVELASWIQRDVAIELLERAGYDLDDLKAKALIDGFQPIPLGITMEARLENTIERGESYNVGGWLRGSQTPDEAFIYTAHWDHIGTKHSDDPDEDVIYNGAVDNATGVAALIELAHAFTGRAEKTQRSVAFLAVTAEESGKLGSLWYAENPVFPMAKTVSGLNMDALRPFGPMKDIMVVGYGASELEDILREAAAGQGRTVTPEPDPERGSYYRSDHFSFARKGVPMLYAKAGTEHRDKGSEYVSELRDDYNSHRYHQPGDEVSADWDVRGIIENVELYYEVGANVADGDHWPQWRPGNEFRSIREASLQ